MPSTPQPYHPGPVLLPAVIRASLEHLLERVSHTTRPRSEGDNATVALVRSWLTAVVACEPRIMLGTIVATPGALATVPNQDIRLALLRHSVGDWGDLDAHDWLENDAAVTEGRRILSAYSSRSGTRFWIITEADRAATTILLPEEY